MKKIRVSKTAAASALVCGAVAPAFALWLQVQGDSRHTGWADAPAEPPYTVIWARTLDDEMIHHSAQVILDGERAYIGTWHGNAYALRLETGQILWRNEIGACLSSCAVNKDHVYFTTQTGYIHAFDKRDGGLKTNDAGHVWWWPNVPKQVWRQPLGKHGAYRSIWASPAILDDRLYVGTRGGEFLCIDLNEHRMVWRFVVPAPICQTAAVDGRHVYFGAEDLRVYCLDVATGAPAWRSEPLPGIQTFRDYWPVVGAKTVTFTGMPSYQWRPAGDRRDLFTTDGVYDEETDWRPFEISLAERLKRLSAFISAKREWQCAFTFDKESGREAMVLPILYCSGAGATQVPPAITPDGVIYFKYLYSPYGTSPSVLFGRAAEDGSTIESLPGFELVGGGWGTERFRPANWKPVHRSMLSSFLVGDHPTVFTLAPGYLYAANSWYQGGGAGLHLETMTDFPLIEGGHKAPKPPIYEVNRNFGNFSGSGCVSICSPYLVFRENNLVYCVKSADAGGGEAQQ